MNNGGRSLGQKPEREGQLVELVGDQNPSPAAPPRGERAGSKGDVRGGSVKKSKYVRITEGEEVRKNDSIEYILFKGVVSIF